MTAPGTTTGSAAGMLGLLAAVVMALAVTAVRRLPGAPALRPD